VSFAHSGKCATGCWCEIHAQEAGVFDPHAYALLDRVGAAERRRGESSPRCPVCDCSQRDFERQGRFGCPACYGAFAGLLQPMVQRMHRGVEHHGKIPARGADSASMRHRLAILQAELSEAVRSEKFEGAAHTRDAIEALKAKLREESAPRSHSTRPVKPPAA
jgi:protein arginine kinase activator